MARDPAYLYGDSTPSELTSNFLEFLRDAMDFSVFLVQADTRLALGRRKMETLRRDSAGEAARLARFVSVVVAAVDSAEKGAAESPTAACAASVKASLADAERTTTALIDQLLAAEIAQIENDELATRNDCTKALGALLVPHEPPGTTGETRITLGASGRYEAARSAAAPFGLAWTFDIAIDEASLWSAPVRIDRLSPHLEIRAPQLTGWISKEVKIRAQRLERLVVTELRDDGETVRVKLRGEAAAAELTGFDIELASASRKLAMARVGPAEDASVGVFDVAIEDAPALVDLVEKLHASVTQLGARQLAAATVDGVDVAASPAFAAVVQRLVGAMAPIVREIAEHSLTQDELVIRRPLGNDRREEIFVSKATLRDKYAPLGDAARAIFAPLGLEPKPLRAPTAEFPPAQASASARASASAPAPASALAAPPVVRAELPRSKPPPPMPAPSKPAPAKRDAREAREHRDLPKSTPVLDVTDALVEDVRSSSPTLEKIVASAPIEHDSRPTLEVADAQGRNAAMSAALKKIATLARNGRLNDAYAEYATLFASPGFADYRPDDQRDALRLMLLAKEPPPSGDAVIEAYRAALTRLTALASALGDPSDHEMIGVAHLVLGDKAAAAAAFATALDRERQRNPASPLCASLEKRITAV